MDNLEDLRGKIFFECRNIIETLSAVTTADELQSKKDLAEELIERISFLKVLEKNKDYFLTSHAAGTEIFGEEIISQHIEDISEEENNRHEPLEEEVKFTNELNDIHNEEDTGAKDELENPVPEKISYAEEVHEVELAVTEIPVEPEIIPEEIMDTKEEAEAEHPQEIRVHKSDLPFEEDQKQTPVKHKFRLSHIKGMAVTGSLFDEDPLEKEIPATPKATETTISLVKTNVPTDYMEAEKPKPALRLDINDKIAFSKNLFGGSQSELNETVRILNEFKTLDDAKEYLSEVYYAKKWEKVDEYAQRLWSLVENKFS